MDYLNPTAQAHYKLSDIRIALEESGHFISQRRLQQLCDSGEIESVRTDGGHRRIPDYEFKRIMRERGGKPARVKPYQKRKSNLWSDHNHLKALEQRYGITPEEYQAMCDVNHGRCTICDKQPHIEYADRHARIQRLNVDHDHKTGAVRGLLCQPCNGRVAFAGDNIEEIRRLLAYVEGRLAKPAQMSLFVKDNKAKYVA